MKLQYLSSRELRLMREEKNLAVDDLASLAGISPQTIIAAEAGYPGVVESLDMMTLKKWQKVCSVPLLKRLSKVARRYIKQKSNV